MKKMKFYLTVIFVVTICLAGLLNSLVLYDGKLLRGEKWSRFSVDEKKADFYVSMDGDDTWSGTLASPNASKTDGPFATLERAQEAVRLLKTKVFTDKKEPVEKRWIGSPHKYGEGKDILVLIRDGYYSLEKPLFFGPKDGGERCETELPSGAFEYHKLKDYYVTYAAFPGESPVISGARKINSWRKNNEKWVTTVKNLNIKKLIANDNVQTLARIPNTGYFTPAVTPEKTTEFQFNKGELKEWSGLQDSKIVMLLRWHTGVNSIADIDEKKRIAYLKEPQKGLVVVPPRYYIENVEALLDAPGEWFYNKSKNQLTYQPTKDIGDPNKADIVVPVLSQLMQVKGEAGNPVRNLRFYNLNFVSTNSGSNAITFEYAHACELMDSKVKNVGGIAISLAKGCYQNRISGNEIGFAEHGAVSLNGNGHPELWSDIIRENIVSYNYISDCGGTNIGAYNCLNTTISHNELTRTRGRYTIYVGGWANLEEAIDGGYRVEYNHLHQVQNGADDSGAITCAGMTCNSIIRRNLIHSVKAGYFNDNVAFWFDNMSSGWISEENIYYNLEQGEMKLCAANLVDNTYRDNFLIEAPANNPEGIIEGEPEFVYSHLKLDGIKSRRNYKTGEFLTATAKVKNTGATGIRIVDLYVDGKVVQSQKIPVIHNNSRDIAFKVRFHEPGEHNVAIGSTSYQSVIIDGPSLDFLYDDLEVSDSIFPVGEIIVASAFIKNVKRVERTVNVPLYIDKKIVDTKSITIAPGKSQKVIFHVKPEKGSHLLTIGDTPAISIKAYPFHIPDVSKMEWKQHCSATALPCNFENKADRYTFDISGTDFYHAEDSYGSMYLKDAIKGNFVATVKVVEFGERTHEWFRAGLFVRNDISKSYDTEAGSLGSMLVFTTPGRYGIQWDEHGDGCMHKANSQNHVKINPVPMWIKLVRHGNSFSGYLSYDGENWINKKTTLPVPGLSEKMDIGLAAGSCDQNTYKVIFEDFQLIVEDEN